MKNTAIIAPFVCAVGLLLSGCQDKTSAPGASATGKPLDISQAAANTLEVSGKKLSFATVDYEPRENPNFLTPCFFVAKGVREKALDKDNFVMEYSITYMSGGRQVTKNATTRLSQSFDHVHETSPDKKNYIALADHIDITGQLPDADTKFTGKATLSKEKKNKGGDRDVEDTAILPGGQ